MAVLDGTLARDLGTNFVFSFFCVALIFLGPFMIKMQMISNDANVSCIFQLFNAFCHTNKAAK